MADPTRTAMIIISDFEEGGNTSTLAQRVSRLVESGVRMIGCAALVDGSTDATGSSYNVGIAKQLVAVGMRIAPVSPVQLARWVGEVLRD